MTGGRNVAGGEYGARLAGVLGEGAPGRPEPRGWGGLEASLGVELPADFKEIVAAYAPVQLNGHLILWHPDTAQFNLAQRVERNIRAFEAIDWRALGVTFRGGIPRFGGPDGLIPVAGTDRGETVFLHRAADGASWSVVGFSGDGDGDGERFHEYELDFAEWLHGYLAGEERVGRGSAVFYPGPLLIEDLPRSPGERVVKRFGPQRGM
ncbi:SMI1/KNR4 family protein [Kitasatospora sp. NPDC093806]|uniref:SMI1/KNR4 family protein n=1 Tax=Kitasatospora sp. NPDC093806 TaxID=3155075 RepID=UPI00341F4FF8